jgi:hypothetical protein
MHKRRTANDSHSTECVLGEVRQNESRAVDVLVVVAEELLLLLWGERAHRLRELTLGILAAHHEADLAGGVGWDGRVGVLDVREDLLAILLELGDQWEVEPLVLSCEWS